MRSLLSRLSGRLKVSLLSSHLRLLYSKLCIFSSTKYCSFPLASFTILLIIIVVSAIYTSNILYRYSRQEGSFDRKREEHRKSVQQNVQNILIGETYQYGHRKCPKVTHEDRYLAAQGDRTDIPFLQSLENNAYFVLLFMKKKWICWPRK